MVRGGGRTVVVDPAADVVDPWPGKRRRGSATDGSEGGSEADVEEEAGQPQLELEEEIAAATAAATAPRPAASPLHEVRGKRRGKEGDGEDAAQDGRRRKSTDVELRRERKRRGEPGGDVVEWG